MSRSIRPRVLLAAAAASLIAALGFAAPAAAHTAPIPGGVPADGATVEEMPKDVTIVFGGALLAGGEGASITADPTGKGEDWTAGAPIVDESTLTIPVDPKIPAGEYTVTWRVVAEDGHPLSGTQTFTYAPTAAEDTPAPDASATSEASESSAVDTAAPTETAVAPETPAVTETPAATDDGSSALPWIIGGGVVVAAALIVGLALRSRPRRD